MSQYVTGATIRTLREKKGYTQKQLAELLCVSDKAISKWETQRGLPDISLLESLAKALGTSVAELLSGEFAENRNRSSNLLRGCFYVCPVCGNVITSSGEGAFSCCGIMLPSLEAEQPDETHQILVEKDDGEYYVTMTHPMTKEHSVSFLAYVTSGRIQFVKLYPEQEPEARFRFAGPGKMFAYCNRHGLFAITVR